MIEGVNLENNYLNPQKKVFFQRLNSKIKKKGLKYCYKFFYSFHSIVLPLRPLEQFSLSLYLQPKENTSFWSLWPDKGGRISYQLKQIKKSARSILVCLVENGIFKYFEVSTSPKKPNKPRKSRNPETTVRSTPSHIAQIDMARSKKWFKLKASRPHSNHKSFQAIYSSEVKHKVNDL